MQRVEIKLTKDQVCDYIIRYLIQDIKPEDYDKYRVECSVNQNYNEVSFTIIKTEIIGEFTAELEEKFDSSIIKNLISVLINDEYILGNFEFIVECLKENPKELEFNGVNFILKPINENETFVDQKRLEKRY